MYFTVSSFFEEGDDWERMNRLKVYEGLYCMATRNFKKAASLFLDSISAFTTYENFPYDTFIFYIVLTRVITLNSVSLKKGISTLPTMLCFLIIIILVSSITRNYIVLEAYYFFLKYRLACSNFHQDVPRLNRLLP
jgi:26S proteasome regulatory subunit N7